MFNYRASSIDWVSSAGENCFFSAEHSNEGRGACRLNFSSRLCPLPDAGQSCLFTSGGGGSGSAGAADIMPLFLLSTTMMPPWYFPNGKRRRARRGLEGIMDQAEATMDNKRLKSLMSGFVFILAAALLPLTAVVHADEDKQRKCSMCGFYGGAEIGWAMPEDIQLSGMMDEKPIERRYGIENSFLFGLSMGYDNEIEFLRESGIHFRTEAEYLYRKHDVSNRAPEFGRLDKLRTNSLFFNLYPTFLNNTGFIPYLGAGIGIMQAKTRFTRFTDNGMTSAPVDDFLSNYQILAGFDSLMTTIGNARASLGLKARYVKSINSLSETLGIPSPVEVDIDSDFFGVSVNLKIFLFGAPSGQ